MCYNGRICGCGSGPASKSHFPLGQLLRKRDCQGNCNRHFIISSSQPLEVDTHRPNQLRQKLDKNYAKPDLG